MNKAKRVAVFIVLVTWLLAQMDWQPIHYQWWHHGQWPSWALGDFSAWSSVRTNVATFVCPPCGALAENYYFVLMEIEAGAAEQAGVLRAPYSRNPLFPDGGQFWWGQGEGAPWRPVSMLAWYLYWLPKTLLWWWLYAGDLFSGNAPWWLRALRRGR